VKCDKKALLLINGRNGRVAVERVNPNIPGQHSLSRSIKKKWSRCLTPKKTERKDSSGKVLWSARIAQGYTYTGYILLNGV